MTKQNKADYSALFFFIFFKKTLDIFFKMCYTIIVPREGT